MDIHFYARFLRSYRILPLALIMLLFGMSVSAQDLVRVKGELKKWHRVSVLVECPETVCGVVSQTSDPNPFTDYRLLVTFTAPDGEDVMEVPGFYAGDGEAERTEAEAGNVWMVHFAPHKIGTWTYAVSFQSGADIVLHRDPGIALSPDGAGGAFEVDASDKTGGDFRGRGFIQHRNSNYFYFSEEDTPFLKHGAGSPENILFYHEFHNTYQQDSIPRIPAHQFTPHVNDFNPGDPLWGPLASKGKGVIGALNYLASLGINSYYFIVNNTALNGEGQGTGVWPWIAPDEASRDRFSVAKLAQWDVVFSHMDSLGIAMNMVTQDRINQWDLDDGELGRIRKLFYRELIARFAHHPGLVWNLGEENSGTTDQIKAYSNFISNWDAYDHPIVSQSNGTLDAHERYYTPLLGFQNFNGASMQVGLPDFDDENAASQDGKIHDVVLKWVGESKKSGHPWVVMLDEIGHWSDGVVPDGDMRDPTNRRARREGFWGTLFAGGTGFDWYFGSDPFEYNDIWTEDFTVRAEFFERTRKGIDMIMESETPFWEMENRNEISSREDTWVFGKEGVAYFVYTPFLDPFELLLPAGQYSVRWYDAFSGGSMQEGTVTEVEIDTESSWVSIGEPAGFAEDAVALVTAKPVDTSRESEMTPQRLSPVLRQNYPNPVHTETTIEFELARPGRTALYVYDVLGRTVRVLEDAWLAEGVHRYVLDASDLPAGIYAYRLLIGEEERVERFMLKL